MREPLLDIFTKKPIETESEEHILLASLGGCLASKQLIDKTTNDRLGHQIDAPLERMLRPFRLMTGALSSRGTEAQYMTVEGKDGKKYRISSGGGVGIIPQGTVTRTAEREFRLEATVANERDLRQMLKKSARESGHNVNDLVAKAMAIGKNRREQAPTVNFNLSWSPTESRACAKSVCSLLAHFERRLFMGGAFDPVRDFVVSDSDARFVQLVAFDPPNSIGQVDHLIRIERHDDERVFGLMVLFGHIAALVSLGSTASNFAAHSYRVDPLGGAQRVDESSDLQWPLPDWSDQATMDTDWEALQAQLHKVVPVVGEIQHRSWLHSVVGPHIEAWFEEERTPGGISAERRQALIGNISSALIRELMPSILASSEKARDKRRREDSSSHEEHDD